MWRLLVKNSEGLWVDLDIDQEEILLCFEEMDAEKLEDRFASGTYNIKIYKTVKNNNLFNYIISQQSYTTGKTYIKCELLFNNEKITVSDLYIQIISQEEDFYNIVIVNDIKNIFEQLERIGFNENNKEDSEYYNILGKHLICSNLGGLLTSQIAEYGKNDVVVDALYAVDELNETAHTITDNDENEVVIYSEPYYGIYSNRSIKTNQLYNITNNSYPGELIETFRYMPYNYPVLDVEKILSKICDKMNINFVGIDKKSSLYDAKLYILPKYRKSEYKFYIYGGYGSEVKGHLNTDTDWIGPTAKALQSETINLIRSDIKALDVRQFNSKKFNIDPDIESSLAFTVEFDVPQHIKLVGNEGEECVFINIYDSAGNIDYFKLQDFIHIGITSNDITIWSAPDIPSYATSEQYFLDRQTIIELFNYITNIDNWSNYIDETGLIRNKIRIVLDGYGGIFASDINEYEKMVSVYSRTSRRYLISDIVNPILNFKKNTTFNIRFNTSYLDADNNVPLKWSRVDRFSNPNIIRNSYKFEDSSGSNKYAYFYQTTSQNFDYSLINIQDVIGFQNAKELLIEYMKATGTYMYINYDKLTQKISLILYPRDQTVIKKIDCEVTKRTYELDKKYNELSYVEWNSYDKFKNVDYEQMIKIAEEINNDNSSDGTRIPSDFEKEHYNAVTNLSYINNPRYNTVGEALFSSNFVCPPIIQNNTTISSVEKVALIPYGLSDNELSGDCLLISVITSSSDRSFVDYSSFAFDNFGYFQNQFEKIYSNYCKIECKAFISKPENYIGKVVYLNKLHCLAYIAKIDKYNGITPSELTCYYISRSRQQNILAELVDHSGTKPVITDGSKARYEVNDFIGVYPPYIQNCRLTFKTDKKISLTPSGSNLSKKYTASGDVYYSNDSISLFMRNEKVEGDFKYTTIEVILQPVAAQNGKFDPCYVDLKYGNNGVTVYTEKNWLYTNGYPNS